MRGPTSQPPRTSRSGPALIPAAMGLMVVLCLLAGALGCGTEAHCPTGTAGSPCIATGDIGPQPTIPNVRDAGLPEVTHGAEVAAGDTEDLDTTHDGASPLDAQGPEPDGDAGASAEDAPSTDTPDATPNAEDVEPAEEAKQVIPATPTRSHGPGAASLGVPPGVRA